MASPWKTDIVRTFFLSLWGLLTLVLLWNAPVLEFSRLWTFTDFTGAAGGDVWAPASERWLLLAASLALDRRASAPSLGGK